MPIRIPFLRLPACVQTLSYVYQLRIAQVGSHSRFLLGEVVARFGVEVAKLAKQ